MSTSFSIHIDPADVLGVARDASLEEIRDAYRAKAKRYHPDAGGEDWAFRVVSQSYEILSTARVSRATDREFASAPFRPGPWTDPGPRTDPGFGPGAWAGPPPGPGPGPDPGATVNESVRPGVEDPATDPTRVVDVERLAIRHQSEHLWLLTDRSNENLLLSCCLNVSWPDPDLSTPPASIEGAEGILKNLVELVDGLGVQSRALSSRTAVADGRFAGWVSYPNVERASAAFGRLRDLLHAQGLSVKQRTRELIIPRPGR